MRMTEGDRRRKARAQQVAGRNYYPKGRLDDGTRVLCSRAKRGHRKTGYHVSTPDPNDSTCRILWVFIGIVLTALGIGMFYLESIVSAAYH